MPNFKMLFSVLLGTLAPAIVIVAVGYAAVKGVRRNPSASRRILLSMLIAFIFVEAMVALALIMVHMLFE